MVRTGALFQVVKKCYELSRGCLHSPSHAVFVPCPLRGLLQTANETGEGILDIVVNEINFFEAVDWARLILPVTEPSVSY